MVYGNRCVEICMPRPSATILNTAWLLELSYKERNCCDVPQLVHRKAPIPSIQVEQPIYYGVEVEHRVEVTRFIEVPVPVEVPVYEEFPRDKEVARVAGGWVLIDDHSNVNQDLLHGRSMRKPTQSQRVAELARIKSPQSDLHKHSHFPRSPLARKLVKPPKSYPRRWDAPKFMAADDLDLLQAAWSRAKQTFEKGELALASATHAYESAQSSLQAFVMREHTCTRTYKTPMDELKQQRAINEEHTARQRTLRLAAARVAQRQARVEEVRSFMNEAEYAVACAREDIRERTAHLRSVDEMKERHSAELAGLMAEAPNQAHWRTPRGRSGLIASHRSNDDR